MLQAEVAFDGTLAGSRNVFLKIGRGRVHLYDQPPRDHGRGGVHHLGIRTDNLVALAADMQSKGAQFRSDIREFGSWRYIMVAAPDDVLLELFEFELDKVEPSLAHYFNG